MIGLNVKFLKNNKMINKQASHLTFAQMARKLGVSKPRITAMVKTGKLDIEEIHGTKMIINNKNKPK